MTTPTIAERIYSALESSADRQPRSHLGASVIGRPCDREVWYTFRWATNVAHSGRILRIFRRGNDEEPRLIEDLRNAGFVVHTKGYNGERLRHVGPNAHIGGELDGIIADARSRNSCYRVLEIKTHNLKSFKDLEKKGVRQSKATHWAQCQLYMLWSGYATALYIGVCKDNDEIYSEKIILDPTEAQALNFRAEMIVAAGEPPSRISERPDWYQCKFCDHYGVCHQGEPLAKNCRTCEESEPMPDGTWVCHAIKVYLSPTGTQQVGCGGHKPIGGKEDGVRESAV